LNNETVQSIEKQQISLATKGFPELNYTCSSGINYSNNNTILFDKIVC